MTPPLTDAQVAALTDVYRNHDLELMGAEDYRVLPSDVEKLALEVQQSRQRRCGGCAHWDLEDEPDGVPVSRVCVKLTDRCDEAIVTEATWSCADFTPKAPTTEGPAS